MDQRQQQIREGAGLEESRLNTEFIDFVQRWGGPFLILCAVAMGGWAAWNWWNRQKASRLDEAFAQYEAQLAGGNPNPIALESVAAEFEGIASVSLLARLDAADIHLAAVRSGVRSGAQINNDGTPVSPDDLLSDEDRRRVLAQAEALYRLVHERASAARGKELLAIEGLYGLAAVAECRGEVDQARGHYDRVVTLAESSGFTNHVALARARAASLDRLSSPAVLLAASELAVRPAPVTPLFPELGGDLGPIGPVAPPEPPAGEPVAPEPVGQPGAEPGVEPGSTEPGAGGGTEPNTPPG